GSTDAWNGIWQLGWCGGGQCTLPLMMQGTTVTRQRALSNLNVIFSKTQASSGLFYAYGNGVEFVGFGYGAPSAHSETFVRSQGDWLYMAQRQFRQIASDGGEVPRQWLSAIRKQADAFVRVWEKYGQLGQFLNVETGELLIGGSTAGAIVCGGLALASQTYETPRYLEVAADAAEKYYQDFVRKGYTTGGPGEILSAPDSESAFGLFEAFMALYEVDGDKKWLSHAADLLPVCASWTVSYDYRFPARSVMHRLDARSCGSVWASVSNKHSAPAICTWSGDCLLKYYRVTGDRRAIEMLADIAHGIPQYISRADCPIGDMPPGGICERVNLSDWEGKDNVGSMIFGSCSWCEAAALLTVTQLPGVYVRPETGFHVVFDHVSVETVEANRNRMLLRLTNPTSFPADVTVFSESERQARQTRFAMKRENTQTVHLEPNESKVIRCSVRP
ncbi:MAG: AGE family epimerase/isomerase, partial [Tannerella sp.]|nr:AGE family epimerase/isomerase [Tannerella sp.]